MMSHCLHMGPCTVPGNLQGKNKEKSTDTVYVKKKMFNSANITLLGLGALPFWPIIGALQNVASFKTKVALP